MYYKDGKFELAAKKYAKIIDFIGTEVYDLDEDKEAARKLNLAANLNLAACYLKMKDYRKAIESCDKSISIDDKNEKGHFRMGQAYLGLAEYDDAIKAFGRVVEINGENKEAANSISLCRQKIKESHDKEKALYSKMISAFSK